MDFGVLSHREASPNAAIPGSTEPKNDEASGSGNLKEKRSELAENSWRVTKMPRPFQVEIPSKKTENFIAFGRSNIWPSGGDDGQKMLSFSSSEPHCPNENYSRTRVGWGPFHLGFSGSNDPEPGRCKRTDGKKWRCSRDAVPDQKYCERHINRGRYRSRKHVEGQTGHAVSGSPTLSVAPIASSALVMSSSLSAVQHKPNSLQPNTVNLVNRKQGFQDHSLILPTISLNAKDATFSTHKQHVPFEESSDSEFGIVCSDALVNPSQRISYLNTKDSGSFLGFNYQDATDQRPVRHFIDDCPKDQSNRASVSWPEELKSDWTQLSMSIPVAPSDFSSSCYPSLQKKPTISTARLSDELDPIHTSLGVSNDIGESLKKQLDWSPGSWGNLMGGPLGEVLTSTTISVGAGMSSSSLKAYDSSPQLDSSPNGVLQKSTIVSLSNNSSGSSHSAYNKRAPKNSSLPNGIGSAIPSL
ncbi:Hypothetical predicted protein [Olea europaea subsp. europaea]|uniref:Growth-regulating factor n=1 Tax=Olea europaea subsp. europaea TaxID=158383 RepID=A0A8S0SP89_OLEEU|nr:Hypothetical predicted protein [Olea europaea subsp. europaea]